MNIIEKLKKNQATFDSLGSEGQEIIKVAYPISGVEMMLADGSFFGVGKGVGGPVGVCRYRLTSDYKPAELPTEEETKIAAEESEEAALACGVRKYDVLRKVTSFDNVDSDDLMKCALCKRHQELDIKTNCPLKLDCRGVCVSQWGEMWSYFHNVHLTGFASAAEAIHSELSRLLREERAKKSAPAKLIVGREYKITPISHDSQLPEGTYTISHCGPNMFTQTSKFTVDGYAHITRNHTFELIQEEKLIECEVYGEDGMLLFDYAENEFSLFCAVNIPNFVGFKYESDGVLGTPRLVSLSTETAVVPTHVLFKKGG